MIHRALLYAAAIRDELVVRTAGRLAVGADVAEGAVVLAAAGAFVVFAVDVAEGSDFVVCLRRAAASAGVLVMATGGAGGVNVRRITPVVAEGGKYICIVDFTTRFALKHNSSWLSTRGSIIYKVFSII